MSLMSVNSPILTGFTIVFENTQSASQTLNGLRKLM